MEINTSEEKAEEVGEKESMEENNYWQNRAKERRTQEPKEFEYNEIFGQNRGRTLPKNGRYLY